MDGRREGWRNKREKETNGERRMKKKHTHRQKEYIVKVKKKGGGADGGRVSSEG